MAIRKLWGSRADKASVHTFVGQIGTLFYEEPGVPNQVGLRVSDGVTPGGIPLPVELGSLSSGTLQLSPGSSIVSPLKFIPGQLQNNPVSGSIEFDGNHFMATPMDNFRGLIPSEMIYVLGADRTYTPSTPALSSVLGVGGTIPVGRYMFRVEFSAQKSGSGNHVLSVGTNGTCQLSRISYWVTSEVAGVSHTDYYNSIASSPLAVTGNVNANQPITVRMFGVIDCASTGTFIPSIAWDTAPGTVTVKAHSRAEMWPISSTTSTNTVIGNWA